MVKQADLRAGTHPWAKSSLQQIKDLLELDGRVLSDQIRGCGVHRVVGIGIHWAAHAVLDVVDVGHLLERPARGKKKRVGVGGGVGVTTCFGLN